MAMPADRTIAATASPTTSVVATGMETAQSCPGDASSSLSDAVFGLVLLLGLFGLIILLARSHPRESK